MKTLLAEMEAYGRTQGLPLLRAAELPLVQRLAAQQKPQRILEVGTAIGYSALQIIAQAPPHAELITIEADAARAAAARAYIARSPYATQIHVHCGDATALLGNLQGPWDLVFLDGPKGQYGRQLQLLLPQLCPGALILADNIRYHDMLYREGTLPHKHRTAIMRLRAFLDYIGDRRHFETVFFENGDGLTVSRWKG